MNNSTRLSPTSVNTSKQEQEAALLQHGIDYCEVNPEEIIAQFGTWVVTEYGLECLTDDYAIERNRLQEPDWLYHMNGKTGVNICDFQAALFFARHYRGRFRKHSESATGKALRFRVLRRDGYRCQICGKTAVDGTRLEVDHRVARANGGKTTEDNLWTLCFSCNRGKMDKEL